jgi:hypothetical protein
MMYKEIVVAKYKEDVSWLKDITIPVYVYDKCPEVKCEVELPENVVFIPLDNLRNAREAHSYLAHIVSRMDELADLTFFVQGDPFEHCPDFMDRIKIDYEDATSLTTQYTDTWPDWDIKQLDKVDYVQGFEVRYGDAYRYTNNKYYHNQRWLDMIWTKVFPMAPLPQEFHFGYGAMWAVPRKRILQRLPQFWSWCLHEVTTEPKILTAWSYEVLWKYIFDDSNKYKDVFGYINAHCHLPRLRNDFPCMYG